MKVLMVGAGGREHALIRKLKESNKVTTVYCTPGNGGISRDAECFDIPASDIKGVITLAESLNVDLVFVAPDDPLSAGMVDALEAKGIRAFGPKANAAILEGSKVFSKNLMKKHNIPTAAYEVFDNATNAIEYIKTCNKYPTVIKADGLALGKGVIIAQDFAQAQDAVNSIMTEKVFGESGNRVVVEEFLTGPEVTVLAFTDGKTVVPMVSSMDHKRIYDGDKGPNTGGMGTISPNPHYTKTHEEYCMEHIFIPTINAMKQEGRSFKGCLYFGLILTPDGVKVIEYNARFGDPEAQVVLPRLKTPLIDIIDAIIDERLSEILIEWDNNACACVVMASGGYPNAYQNGFEISGLDANGQHEGVTIYHSGTIYKNGKFVTNCGRVLGITAKAKSLEDALSFAYQAANKITFNGAHFRKDIGKK